MIRMESPDDIRIGRRRAEPMHRTRPGAAGFSESGGTRCATTKDTITSRTVPNSGRGTKVAAADKCPPAARGTRPTHNAHFTILPAAAVAGFATRRPCPTNERR